MALFHLVLATSAALLCGGTDADGGPRAPSAVVSERRLGSVYTLDGSFTVAAPPATAWNVLTDYDRLPRIIRSVRRSHLAERREGEAIVEQDLEAKVWFISKSVHLRLLVQETPMTEIVFRDVSRRDFLAYRGSWRIATHGQETKVDYHLEARPREDVPAFILEDTLQTSTAGLLNQLREEMFSRSKNPEGKKP